MALRCVYTDLDGTLLGRGSSLFRDADGGFSLAQARALEACARAGVEVVIMSGRREPQVHEAARLMGQTSYIYEAGCAFAVDGETTLMTGEMQPGEEGTIYEQIEHRGVPRRLFEHFEGRLEYHSPWHHGRVLSHLFRGKVVDVAPESLTIELAGPEDKIEAFVELMKPYTITELARTGVIAVQRGMQIGSGEATSTGGKRTRSLNAPAAQALPPS